MIMQHKFVLILIISLVNSYELPYKFYKFQQQWPGSICLSQQCQKQYIGTYQGKSWTIHGLWPGVMGESGLCEKLEFCTQNKLTGSNLSKQTTQTLDQVWIGFYNPSESFRAHEWKKHGTCWDDNYGQVSYTNGRNIQEKYFSTTVQLWKNYNIYEILSNSGIKPDNNKFYYTNTIIDTLKRQLGTVPYLLCTKDQQNKLLLISVTFCLDEQYQPSRCPCNDLYGGIPCGSKKNEEVRYPTFQL